METRTEPCRAVTSRTEPCRTMQWKSAITDSSAGLIGLSLSIFAVLNGRVLGPLEGSGCSKRDESLLLIFCSSLKLVSFNSLPIARCLQFQKAIQFLGRDPFYTRIYSSVTLSPPDPLVLLSSPVVFLSISAPHLTSSVLRLLSQPVLYFSFFTLSFRWLQFWHLHYFKYFPHIRRIAQ